MSDSAHRSPPSASPPTVATRLLGWYDAHRRDLPWRRDTDPYRVWISEVMLQQTRVETVLPYYERFLARFPDVAALAAAEVDEVLALWSGLGYYRRARQMHAAARQVVAEHGGRFPPTLEGLRSLPGIGEYTAAAVGSICFGLPEPVMDGNVERVVARLLALDGDPKSPPVRRRLLAAAAELLHPERPGDSNQALMELGATVCTPRRPKCLLCPLREPAPGGREAGLRAAGPEVSTNGAGVASDRAAAAGAMALAGTPGTGTAAGMGAGEDVEAGEAEASGWDVVGHPGCRALAAGEPEAFPPPRRRRPAERQRRLFVLVEEGGRRLLFRRSDHSEVLAGTWELPWVEVPVEGRAAASTAELLARRYGGRWEVGRALGRFQHGITYRSIEVRVHHARWDPTGGVPVEGERPGRPESDVEERRGEKGTGEDRRGEETRVEESVPGWHAPSDLERLPLSSMVTKALQLVDAGGGEEGP